MPFGTRKAGNKIEVVNLDTGRVLGKHPNRAAANKQLAALAIHVPEAFKDKPKSGGKKR